MAVVSSSHVRAWRMTARCKQTSFHRCNAETALCIAGPSFCRASSSWAWHDYFSDLLHQHTSASSRTGGPGGSGRGRGRLRVGRELLGRVAQLGGPARVTRLPWRFGEVLRLEVTTEARAAALSASHCQLRLLFSATSKRSAAELSSATMTY